LILEITLVQQSYYGIKRICEFWIIYSPFDLIKNFTFCPLWKIFWNFN